ncbi:MAG: Holliday junction resolvase RuvX [Candidatus Marinimicrobia bacterium]|nr:Holliday junction resolvase RuvX [Candidatus Neomarinimicrobiota bacterium]
MGRIMSIDYGEKRVGIALSDPLHTISYPLCVINKKNENQLVDEIIKIINDKLVEKIIIGLPLSMSGSYSEQTKKVIIFKDFLIKELSDRNLNIDIDTIDERLSSVSAKNIMIQQGVKTGHNKGRIDELSASIILQEYLDSK